MKASNVNCLRCGVRRTSGATLRRGSAVALGVGLTLVAADEERGSSDDGVASGAGVEGDQADPRVVSDGL